LNTQVDAVSTRIRSIRQFRAILREESILANKLGWRNSEKGSLVPKSANNGLRRSRARPEESDDDMMDLEYAEPQEAQRNEPESEVDEPMTDAGEDRDMTRAEKAARRIPEADKLSMINDTVRMALFAEWRGVGLKRDDLKKMSSQNTPKQWDMQFRRRTTCFRTFSEWKCVCFQLAKTTVRSQLRQDPQTRTAYETNCL